MFGLFGRKKEVEKLRKEVGDSFENVKRDFGKVGEWIKYIDEKEDLTKKEVEDLKQQLLDIQSDMVEIKEFISFFGPRISSGVFEQQTGVVDKQAPANPVQTPVQTAVQTGILPKLTVMERAIVWALLNAGEGMKLSYDDLATLLGKGKSTIRGQINTLKQKSEGLIRESQGAGGKKRLYIPDEMKQMLLKNVKVRVEGKKKNKKSDKKEEN